ncbi:MAG: cell wall-binding repeat-containing protein, partial [Dermatophilaceae bacterium]
SETVVNTLAGIAPVDRVGGPNRYETGLGIVNATFSSARTAFIATGRTFPDALAATGAAGTEGAPVILVDGLSSSAPASTLATLQRLGVQNVAIAGSNGAVSDGIANQLRSAGYVVTRFGGSNRYETAALINDAFFAPGSTHTMFLATGTNFPDGLAGGAVAGRLGAPLYVTDGACVPPAVRTSIINIAPPKRVVLGSAPTVSDAAAANLGCLTAPVPTISGTPRVGSTLTANAGMWTPETSLSYRWFANGAAVGTGTSIALTSAHQGKAVTVQVTGSLPEHVTVTRTSRATAAVALATLTSSIPTIAGTAQVGETLTANPGTWTPGATLSYQWYSNGAAAGSGRTLPLTAAHQGKRITVRVTGSMPGYATVARTSSATAAIAAAPPRVSGYVTPGAFCKQENAGWIGYTVTGVKMQCKTSATDSRLRWRAV